LCFCKDRKFKKVRCLLLLIILGSIVGQQIINLLFRMPKIYAYKIAIILRSWHCWLLS
jgi:hypothetical protein